MGNCFGCIRNLRSNRKRCSTDEEDDQETELVQNEDNQGHFIYRIIKFKRKKTRRPQFLDKYWDQGCNPRYSRLHQHSCSNSLKSHPIATTADIQLQSLNAQYLLNSISTANETNIGLNNIGSRASSSLDLEWENEYGHDNHALHHSWLYFPTAKSGHHHPPTTDTVNSSNVSIATAVTDNNTYISHNYQSQAIKSNQMKKLPPRTSSRNSWSHISTPESLEWDVDEDERNKMYTEDDNLDHDTLQLLHEIEILKNQVLSETGFDCLGITTYIDNNNENEVDDNYNTS